MSSASPTTTAITAAATTAVAGGARSRGFQIFLKFWTLGVILSSIAYGIAFTLFAACLYLLKKTSAGSRKRVHYALAAYITLMFALSTISIVSGISTNLTAITSQTIPRSLSLGGSSPDAVVIVLANWASDGFLLWRASVLYEGVTKSRRQAVYALIIFMLISQFTSGTLYLCSNFVKRMQKHERPIFVAFASTTLFVNWVITGLVVIRLLVFRSKVRKTLGNVYGSPYTGIISMCVESAALVILFATIFLTLNLLKLNPFSFSRAFLVHIYVIAPLLIIYRVAQGKAFITNTTSFYSQNGENSQTRSGGAIRFNTHHPHTTTGVSTQATRIEVNVTHDEVKKADNLTYYDDMEMGTRKDSYHVDSKDAARAY
ncbi:hypothetical protein CVT24_004908 [Panaeolus cyanescens]|uniref:Uncharacterized protein n=1 Tax=Panaeolus cyanescens TaxID=181874 RepID=A0A409YB14_9AGAR|nr:hypothetical protein CVT24_004908 [Panaeolus cyanescens]